MSTYKQGWPSDKDGDLEGRLLSYEERSALAQANAAHAYDRLLHLAETRDSGQARIIAQFIASTYNGTASKFDLFDLRALDVKISDDMLAGLDALRWGKADLFRLVPDGEKRLQAVIALWGLQPTA
jgi:hypothetical protein